MKKCDKIAFFLFGLVNNFVYVVFLSAAHDIITYSSPSHTSISEGSILLADILPSLIVKLVAPYTMHNLSYKIRVISCSVLTTISLILVSYSSSSSYPSINLQFIGIIMAAFSSGLGEISFLALTCFYGPLSVGYWGSGTGAAGIIGSLVYLILTSWLNLSLKLSLLVLAVFPSMLTITYFYILSHPPLILNDTLVIDTSILSDIDENIGGQSSRIRSRTNDSLVLVETCLNHHDSIARKIKKDGYVELPSDQQHHQVEDSISTQRHPQEQEQEQPPLTIRERMDLTKSLIVPYMIPLFIVFWAEYTINQGVAPFLIFPLDKTPFRHSRDHYVTYQCLYQIGVFISRSSIEYVKIRNIWALSLLQVLTLILLFCQAIWMTIIPSVYLVFAVILWEGLLGGACYVNAFHRISSDINRNGKEKEFSMAVTALADTLGITFAGLTSMLLKSLLQSSTPITTPAAP